MKHTNHGLLFGTIALAATFAGCSAGSGSDGGSTSTMTIENISVPANAQWQINRPIAITFSS